MPKTLEEREHIRECIEKMKCSWCEKRTNHHHMVLGGHATCCTCVSQASKSYMVTAKH